MTRAELIERLEKVSGDLKDATPPTDMDELQSALKSLGLKDEAKQIDEAKWAVWRSASALPPSRTQTKIRDSSSASNQTPCSRQTSMITPLRRA